MDKAIFSPDGKFMWTGEEWIPAPPTQADQPSVDIDINDSVVMGDITINSEKTNCTKCGSQNVSIACCPICKKLDRCQFCPSTDEYKAQFCHDLTELKTSACLDCFEKIYQEGCDKVCSNCNVCFVEKGNYEGLCFTCLVATRDLESYLEDLNRNIQGLKEKSEELVESKLKLQTISNKPDSRVEKYHTDMEIYHEKMEIYNRVEEEIEEDLKNGKIGAGMRFNRMPAMPLMPSSMIVDPIESISSEIKNLERNIKTHNKMIPQYEEAVRHSQSILALRREYPSRKRQLE